MRVILILACLTMLAACEQSPEQQARSRDRSVIALCWEEQGAKSLPPAQARFIAGTCEMMTRKFQDKYHANP